MFTYSGALENINFQALKIYFHRLIIMSLRNRRLKYSRILPIRGTGNKEVEVLEDHSPLLGFRNLRSFRNKRRKLIFNVDVAFGCRFSCAKKINHLKHPT